MQALRTDGGVTGPDGRLMYGPGTSTFKMSRAGSASGPSLQQQKPRFRGYSDEDLEEKYARGEISLEQMREFQRRRSEVNLMDQDRVKQNSFLARQAGGLSSAMRSV
jgi:hypothetical protein